jgi:hypothetical protein
VDRESATSASPSGRASPQEPARSPEPERRPSEADGAPVVAQPEQKGTAYPDGEELQRDEVVGVLVAVDGELKGQVYRLFDGENRLGRAESSEVVLPSKWISREHAMLVHHGGIFALVSTNDRNHTYVNGEEVDGVEVADGDAIRLGRTTFRFRLIEGL